MTVIYSKGKSDQVNLLHKIPQQFSTALRLKTTNRPGLISGSFYCQSLILSPLLPPLLWINSYSFFRSQLKFTSLRKSSPTITMSGRSHLLYAFTTHSLSFIALTRTSNCVWTDVSSSSPKLEVSGGHIYFCSKPHLQEPSREPGT